MIRGIAGILPIVLVAACSNPADNTPEASVKPAATIQEGAPVADSAQVSGTRFSIQPGSKVEFVGSKVTGSHSGGFERIAGEFIVADGKLASAGHKILIDIPSIWSDSGRLTGHLKSPDFFDASQYPISTFIATSVEEHSGNHTVAGNLTLHGITKNITFPAKVSVSDTMLTVSAEFHINRFDFDMKYSGKADDLIRKEIVLKLDVKAAPGTVDFAAFEKAAQSTAQ
ncbi:MAG: YceI family protein [Verrucomicrobia bacterium]|nr:YceI family protein [Verrucomicrobiota bacterium]